MIILLLLLILLFGGFGLFFDTLRWMLIIAGALMLAGFFSVPYYNRRR